MSTTGTDLVSDNLIYCGIALIGFERLRRSLDAGYWMLDTRYSILVTGYWIDDTGCWQLVGTEADPTCYSLLVTCHLLLVSGRWILVTGKKSQGRGLWTQGNGCRVQNLMFKDKEKSHWPYTIHLIPYTIGFMSLSRDYTRNLTKQNSK